MLRTSSNNTLKLLGFEDIDVEKCEVEETELEIHIYVTLKKHSIACSNCGCKTNYVEKYYNTIINHNHFSGKKCFLHYRKRRYLCTNCKNKQKDK